LIDYYQWYKNNDRLNTSSLTSSIIIEKVSKEDAGIYICMVKNTLKYSNGSSIEKFNKAQTRVIVHCKRNVRLDFLYKNKTFIFRCTKSSHITSNNSC
jgi:hypothetical protein